MHMKIYLTRQNTCSNILQHNLDFNFMSFCNATLHQLTYTKLYLSLHSSGYSTTCHCKASISRQKPIPILASILHCFIDCVHVAWEPSNNSQIKSIKSKGRAGPNLWQSEYSSNYSGNQIYNGIMVWLFIVTFSKKGLCYKLMFLQRVQISMPTVSVQLVV